MAKLTPELEAHREKICKIAADEGLDFYETIFELVNFDTLNQVASYGGFPVRYPHWRFGMQYEQLSKSYQYGLSKIYELVVNTDPCYAYLMEGNSDLDQKLVMAHVYGHCDFFKNNYWFSQTNRKMMDVLANHATRVRNYIDKHGIDKVESFIDLCLSVENLIDPYAPYSKKRSSEEGQASKEFKTQDLSLKSESNKKLSYEFKNGERDVLNFFIHKAPLEDWQQDVVSIIRAEAYYFAPQGMTKIMNEGWASYWHSKLMTEKIVDDSEIVCFADRHSGTMAMAPNGFNPYKIGIELFRDIKTRWDKGQYGKEWEDCDDLNAKENWDMKREGAGKAKIFEVRKTHNDFTFVDQFLTKEFCVKNKFLVYKQDQKTGQFILDTSDFEAQKRKFLFQLTNSGQPIIKVEHDNYEGEGELLLKHHHEGVDMQPDYTSATLENIQKIWQSTVHLATVMEEKEILYTHDGKEFTNSEG
jgi:stage V sporulation protein R